MNLEECLVRINISSKIINLKNIIVFEIQAIVVIIVLVSSYNAYLF